MKYFLLFLGMFLSLASHAQTTDTDVVDLDAMSGPDYVQASYPGGNEKFYQFISKNIQYPVRCMDENIQGEVRIQFTVNKNGELSNFKPIKKVDACPEFTHEAIRILKKSKRWNPGTKNGLPINSYFAIPLKFNLQ
jgi:TonB family protein